MNDDFYIAAEALKFDYEGSESSSITTDSYKITLTGDFGSATFGSHVFNA